MLTLREQHLANGVAKFLPLLLRYARALTGDMVVAGAMVADMCAAFQFDDDGPRLKAQLFKALQYIWTQNANSTFRGLPSEMFLLHRMEGFSLAELSRIFNLPEPFAFRLLSKSESLVRDVVPTQVLILERDPLLTIDLCDGLKELGYKVAGIARTLPEATMKAAEVSPKVLIADFVLADGNSGPQATVAIAVRSAAVPTVFVGKSAPTEVLEDSIVPGFLLTVPFMTADLEAVMRQAESLSRYEAEKALR